MTYGLQNSLIKAKTKMTQHENVCDTYDDWVKNMAAPTSNTVSYLTPDFLRTHTAFLSKPTGSYNGQELVSISVMAETIAEMEDYIKDQEANGRMVFVYKIGKPVFDEPITGKSKPTFIFRHCVLPVSG